MTIDKWLQLKPNDIIELTDPIDTYNGATFIIIKKFGNDCIEVTPLNDIARTSQWTKLQMYYMYTQIGSGESVIASTPYKKTITNRLANL